MAGECYFLEADSYLEVLINCVLEQKGTAKGPITQPHLVYLATSYSLSKIN